MEVARRVRAHHFRNAFSTPSKPAAAHLLLLRIERRVDGAVEHERTHVVGYASAYFAPRYEPYE
jgi:hypothetical protein